jgi:hypothetical protein
MTTETKPVHQTARDHAYNLLSIIQSHAPRMSAQTMVSEIYNEAIKEGISYEELVPLLAELLSEGLHYNNWPWSVWTNGENSSDVIEIRRRTQESERKFARIVRSKKLGKKA